MELVTLITGPIDVNTYILFGREPGKCLLVDPSDAALVEAELTRRALVPTHILVTHGHFDHVLAVAELQQKYAAGVLVHRADAALLSYPELGLAMFPGVRVKPCEPDLLLDGEETLSLAGFEVDVLHTPGHSKGSVCYLVKEAGLIFCGDTLFRLSAGRTDLPGGDASELYRSIKNELFALAGDYDLYPGHSRKSTLEFERQHNPFMKHGCPLAW